MTSFAELSGIIKKRLDDDREIKSVEVEMPTLEEAVKEAAATLGIPVYNLDYEIIEHKTAFLGFGKNICKLRGYERAAIKRQKREETEAIAAAAVSESAELELVEDIDGEIFVKRLPKGIHIKVTAPLGEGARVTYEDALKAFSKARVKEWDEKAARAAVNSQAGKYIRVGEFKNNPANNAALNVDITEDEMRAFLYINPPGPDGADVVLEDIKQIMSMNGIIAGINEEFLQNFADNPIYREKICIAKGTPPVNGMNSYMQYFFETDYSRVKLREHSDGRVDFRDLNIIQNVRAEQTLAIWNPAEPGKDGMTVTGRLLLAQAGKDTAFNLGNNVRQEPDGHTIVATLDGQVLLVNGKISVEPVLEIEGDVALKTGNIDFNGTVFIKGNVMEGFTVKADGNIEINGAVDKATLISGGDIIVKQGIYGKEGTIVQSKLSVWAKFIENAIIKSGNLVVVSDGIINSQVDAAKRILCQGKRASIVGGRLRAAEEINCKVLGGMAGSTETLCEVAFDPESREKMEELQTNCKTLSLEIDELTLNITTLENQKSQRGGLPDEKEETLQEITAKRNALAANLRETNEEIAQIQERINSLETNGRVSASVKVYAGVCIHIRDAEEKVRCEYKSVSFILEQGVIRTTNYIDTTPPPP